MSGNSIGSQIKDLLFYSSDTIAAYRRVYDMAEKLGILEWGDEPYLNVYLSCYGTERSIELSPAGFNDDGAKVKELVKQLLPKVHHFDKGFNEQTNEITFTATFDGVKIVLRSTPPSTCIVEEYKEDVFVPAVKAKPETTRKVTKYRLVGDCLPVLAGDQ